MQQEEKQLLLKDLCARLLYGVKCDRYGNSYKLVDIDIERELVYLLRDEQYVPYSILNGDIIKPYLRPMSSMTEEEKEEYESFVWYGEYDTGSLNGHHEYNYVEVDKIIEYVDWLNAHHFDYRGLIKKGLALEAPEGMYN